MVRRAERLGRVLDHGNAVPGGDRQQGVEVAGHVLQVHGDDRRRPVGDLRFEDGGIEPQRVVDLGEHGNGTGGDDGVHRRDEREGGDDDLVATADAERRERAPQRGGAVGHRDREGRSRGSRRPLARSRRPCRRLGRPCSGTASGSRRPPRPRRLPPCRGARRPSRSRAAPPEPIEVLRVTLVVTYGG